MRYLFKYISCYCLSAIPDMATNWDCYSNTSHVIVYPTRSGVFRFIVINSNTSHVIVYPGVGSYVGTFWKFKYISCYCLSKTSKIHRPAGQIQIHLMLLFISKSGENAQVLHNSNTSHVIVYRFPVWQLFHFRYYSNTSHVIVYLAVTAYRRYYKLFKYISCYCLSSIRSVFPIRTCVFKYISCYCLSSMLDLKDRLFIIQIHLMLLFIPDAGNIISGIYNSNTSHVIVYRDPGDLINGVCEFKYISCYCLSYLESDGG